MCHSVGVVKKEFYTAINSDLDSVVPCHFIVMGLLTSTVMILDDSKITIVAE